MSTVILAIDPGITGALAFYYADNNRVALHDMPIVDGDVNPHELWRCIKMYDPDFTVLEQVSPMPKEGVSSVWRFAAAYTTARIVVTLLKIPMTLVRPSTWKKQMNLAGGKEGKEQCRSLAIRTFPEQAHEFARKKDHGRSDAAMLAVYASQKLIHKNPTP